MTKVEKNLPFLQRDTEGESKTASQEAPVQQMWVGVRV
jgi:hypothetical protein